MTGILHTHLFLGFCVLLCLILILGKVPFEKFQIVSQIHVILPTLGYFIAGDRFHSAAGTVPSLDQGV